MYIEVAPSSLELAQYVDCFWYSKSDEQANKPALILPDGAMDIIYRWDGKALEAMICGTMLFAFEVPTASKDAYFGVRFIPGMASVFLAENAADFTGQVWLKSLWNDIATLEDIFAYEIHPVAALTRWMEPRLMAIIQLRNAPIHKLAFYRNVQPLTVDDMAKEIGISRKSFYREFKSYFGLAPRDFANIKRLLAFRDLVKNVPAISLSDAALRAGFYDQADMSRQIKKLSGLTPSQLSQLYKT